MSGGGKGGDIVVSYWYSMGVQLAVCHGPVDAVTELVVGERQAWTGDITGNSSFYINKLDLFGGESREGGIRGTIDINMGGSTQPVSPYLSGVIDGPVPAYRGLLTTVFRQFRWSSGNPYFKAPWWRVRRITAGWSRNAPWYTAKARIGDHDMNPAHIIYECLTNLEWGMGYPTNAIDDASFRAAADTLHSEDFGLSLMWMEQTSIQDFIQLVLNHFDGLLRIDLQTGQFQLRLIRNDYDPETVPELNPSNIISLDSFQRSTWGDSANEVVVKYVDRNQKETSVAVQDLASIEAQGGVVSTTRDYPGIREPDLAVRVAMRDLNNVSIPLAKVSITVNRTAWDWDIGDVFKLSWPRLGVSGVPFRIIEINKGTLESGSITLSGIEDVFGMPAAAYVQPVPSGWTDPINQPQPVAFSKTIEAPYWDVVRNVPASDFDYLPDDWAFGEILAVRPTNDAFNFDIMASPNASDFEKTGVGMFAATGTLADPLPRSGETVTISVLGAVGLDDVGKYPYFYIDDEAFGVVNVNPALSQVTASRGVLDTVPQAHAAGTRLYFAGGRGADKTTRSAGETTYYKALTRTGKGVLSLGAAPLLSVTFTGRGHKPYPPGNFRINGVSFPDATYGAGLSATWSHRDRILQTVDFVPHTTGNIGPEPGTEYVVRLYRDTGQLLQTDVLTSATWTYTNDAAHGYPQDLRMELESVRDGEVSWQKYDQIIERHGLGFRLGAELGGVE